VTFSLFSLRHASMSEDRRV